MVILFGQVSGGHFNPAVTLAMLFKEGKAQWMRNFTMAIMMIIAQGIGAAIGTGITATANTRLALQLILVCPQLTINSIY